MFVFLNYFGHKNIFNSVFYRNILCCLTVVFQDDRNVHVDDDEEGYDKVGQQEGDCNGSIPAVSSVSCLLVRWNNLFRLKEKLKSFLV